MTIDFKKEITVEKLSKVHKTDTFDCGDSDINEFLQKDALVYQEKKLATTFIFIYKQEVIGFFVVLVIPLGWIKKRKKALN